MDKPKTIKQITKEFVTWADQYVDMTPKPTTTVEDKVRDYCDDWANSDRDLNWLVEKLMGLFTQQRQRILERVEEMKRPIMMMTFDETRDGDLKDEGYNAALDAVKSIIKDGS